MSCALKDDFEDTMPELKTVNDAQLEALLNGDKPVMVLITSGDGLRGDFKVAYEKAAQEQPGIQFVRIDPTANPKAAARFGAEEKPLLVAWYCGQEVARRLRPWGSDLPLALEVVQNLVKTQTPEQEESETTAVTENTDNAPIVLDAPVTVTDATFEQEVLNSDLPVLVDFWAAWCGPCRMVAPILEKLAGEFAGQIKIAKVDVDANPALSQAFRIQSIPNLMIVKDRTIIFNQPGALPEASMRELVKQAIAFEVPKQQQPAE
jgi:thioredoxin 1